MIKIQNLLLMVAGLLLVSFPVMACMGPPFHEQTYLDKLPVADDKEVVGKVKILSNVVDRDANTELSIVQVVEAVKGVREGQTFVVVSGGRDTCNRDPKLTVGSTHYIAGKFDAEHHFHGIWKEYITYQQSSENSGVPVFLHP